MNGGGSEENCINLYFVFAKFRARVSSGTDYPEVVCSFIQSLQSCDGTLL